MVRKYVECIIPVYSIGPVRGLLTLENPEIPLFGLKMEDTIYCGFDANGVDKIRTLSEEELKNQAIWRE